MDSAVATHYLLALTRQIADLTAEVADLHAQPGRATRDRCHMIATVRAQLRRARRKRTLLLADPLFPRGAPSSEPCRVLMYVPACHHTALAHPDR